MLATGMKTTLGLDPIIEKREALRAAKAFRVKLAVAVAVVNIMPWLVVFRLGVQ